jgi:hypothetical protein
VFPSREVEDSGVGGMRGSALCSGDCMFHGAVHAFVVVFWVTDVVDVPYGGVRCFHWM